MLGLLCLKGLQGHRVVFCRRVSDGHSRCDLQRGSNSRVEDGSILDLPSCISTIPFPRLFETFTHLPSQGPATSPRKPALTTG